MCRPIALSPQVTSPQPKLRRPNIGVVSPQHQSCVAQTRNFAYQVKVGGCRHVIFATRHQLDLLNRAKSWYVDATFKLYRQPFTQLLTVNAFVKAVDYVKQVPLVFVLMSGKRKRDYRAVFRELLELLPSPALQQVTLDLECAVWKVLRQLLPDVKLLGCVFHWTQALWRKFLLQEG